MKSTGQLKFGLPSLTKSVVRGGLQIFRDSVGLERALPMGLVGTVTQEVDVHSFRVWFYLHSFRVWFYLHSFLVWFYLHSFLVWFYLHSFLVYFQEYSSTAKTAKLCSLLVREVALTFCPLIGTAQYLSDMGERCTLVLSVVYLHSFRV